MYVTIKTILALLALLIADGVMKLKFCIYYRLLNSRIILIAVFGMQIETSSSGKSEHVPGYKISIRIRRQSNIRKQRYWISKRDLIT